MRRPSARIGWATAAAALFGGVLLFASRPAARTVAPSGRGAPGIPPSPASRARGHETSDMRVGTVARVLATGFGVVLVSVALLFVMIHFFHREDAAVASLTRQQSAAIVPPEPRLQDDPDRDLRTLRARERATLDAYGWADDAHGRSRIPIARAMQMVVGRSLEPAR